MVKVLALDPIHEDGLALLRARPEVELVHLPTPTDAEILNHLKDAEAVILRARRLEDEMYRQAPKLRLVSRHGVGCDNLKFDLLRELGIGVAIASDSNLVSVAEHAMTLTLAACKNLVRAERAARSGNWAARDNLGARDLDGSAVLVLGFGRIGQAYAKRASAFGARITIYDPFLAGETELPKDYVRATNLEDALAAMDVVSIHMPRTAETANLFSSATLGNMKSGAILVNTARGGIVDEAALLAALDAGRPGFYATDVLADEPPSADDPLTGRDDVIVTPHSAAMTAQGATRMATRSAQNVLDFLDGKLAREMIALAPSASEKETQL